MTVIAHQPPDANESPPPVPERHPFGVRVIIALFMVKVLFMLMVLGLLYLDLSMDAGTPVMARSILQSMPTTALSFILLLPLNLIAAFGLWRRKRWAWVLTMVLLAYSMLLDIVNFVIANSTQGQPIYLAMLLNVIQVGYLNQKEVQALFHTPDKAGVP